MCDRASLYLRDRYGDNAPGLAWRTSDQAARHKAKIFTIMGHYRGSEPGKALDAIRELDSTIFADKKVLSDIN